MTAATACSPSRTTAWTTPRTAASVGGEGWSFVLSGLKTLLETGRPLAG